MRLELPPYFIVYTVGESAERALSRKVIETGVRLDIMDIAGERAERALSRKVIETLPLLSGNTFFHPQVPKGH